MITTAAIVKNEAHKFLPETLSIWGEFSSRMLLLDNDSTDGTAEVGRKAGAEVIGVKGEMWGNEAKFRKRLFEEALSRTPEGEWIFILDADMVPAVSPTPLFEAASSAIAFPLYDIWYVYSDGYLLYREDNFWRGHLYPRIWALQNNPEIFQNSNWGTRGVHSGHFPIDLNLKSITYAPKEFSLLHFAYASDPLRRVKYSQYVKVAEHLSAFEKAHAQSILDPQPQVKRLDFPNNYHLTPP